VNIDRNGHRFPARDITPERVLSVPLMAQSIYSEEPAYYRTDAAREAGYRARPLPPGMLAFFHTMDEKDLSEVLGVTYGKSLAASAEMTQGVVATELDPLVGESWVENAWTKEGKDGVARQLLVLATEFRLQATNEVVSTSRITFIERQA
jgi:hypothetical protein